MNGQADLTFRPIDSWPGALKTERKKPLFEASYDDSIGLLRKEIFKLGARSAVIQVALGENQIRQDGLPYATAKPAHPGVIVAFESKWGPLRYSSDAFRTKTYQAKVTKWDQRQQRDMTTWVSRTMPGWHANIRAIALSLEALRMVDRYGVSTDGEQYRGWNALGSGEAMPMGQSTMTVEEAAAILLDAAGGPSGPDKINDVVVSEAIRKQVYRQAARSAHPDAGGSSAAFALVQAALATLERFS